MARTSPGTLVRQAHAEDQAAVLWREYQRDGEPIRCAFTGDAFINATDMAAAFGKLAKDWLRTDRTKAYADAVARRLFPGDSPDQKAESPSAYGLDSRLVVVINGGPEGQHGTWLHPKLAIDFARWLSPDFAVWCDAQIEDILRSHGPFPPRADDDPPALAVRPESVILSVISRALAPLAEDVASLKLILHGQIGPDVTVAKDTAVGIDRKLDNATTLLGDMHTRMVKDNGKRVYPKTEDANRALETIRRRHFGKCPCCRRIMILDNRGNALPGVCVWDHFEDRMSGDAKRGWYVCDECNKRLGPPNKNADRKKAEPLFVSYQYDFDLTCEEIADENRSNRKRREEVRECSDFLFPEDELK